MDSERLIAEIRAAKAMKRVRRAYTVGQESAMTEDTSEEGMAAAHREGVRKAYEAVREIIPAGDFSVEDVASMIEEIGS